LKEKFSLGSGILRRNIKVFKGIEFIYRLFLFESKKISSQKTFFSKAKEIIDKNKPTHILQKNKATT